MRIFILLLLASINVYAAPFVVSDPSTQTVTHCGVVIDTQPKFDVPVINKACKVDISTVTEGAHTIKATFVNIDPVWGRSESVFSTPLNFVRPSAQLLIAPSNLVITP